MVTLLRILDLGITILVPAVVWTLLAFGLAQFIRESIHMPRVKQQQVARQTHS